MKALLTASVLMALSSTALAIPDPEGQGGERMTRQSDVLDTIESLANDAKKSVGFRTAGESQRILQHYEKLRGVITNNDNQLSVRQDAVRQMNALARQGYPLALNFIGYLMDNGIVVTKNHRSAAQFFYEGARRGDIAAKHNYGVALIMGRGAQKDERAGIKLLEENANVRFPYSAVACGIYYQNIKEDAKANRCFMMASGDRLHPIARTRVAIYQIKSSTRDTDKFGTARALLNQAARLGWPEAQWTLADMERYGIGTKPNAFRTAFWLRILQNNPNTQGTSYVSSSASAFNEISLDERAAGNLDRAVQIWLDANGKNIVPVVDYSKSIPADDRAKGRG